MTREELVKRLDAILADECIGCDDHDPPPCGKCERMKAAILAALSERVPEAITLAVNEALHEADNIILLLTADHNSGPHYVKGFELAQEYMFKRNKRLEQ